jgi:hypothetical protein
MALSARVPVVQAAPAADYNIVVQMGKEVLTPDGMKAGETVQFSSTDGQIQIQFVGEWPFEGTGISLACRQVPMSESPT